MGLTKNRLEQGIEIKKIQLGSPQSGPSRMLKDAEGTRGIITPAFCSIGVPDALCAGGEEQ